MPRLKDEPGSNVVQYTKAGQNHICIHEEWRETVNNDIKELKDDTKDLKNSHTDILLEIKGLRSDLKLTEHQNGYQDAQLKEMKENKKTETEFNYKRASIILSICVLILTAFTMFKGWM